MEMSEGVSLLRTAQSLLSGRTILVQPRKTRLYITERLLIGRKKPNQTNKQNY